MAIEREKIEIIFLEEEMKSSYLDYSMSVITNRALPDNRDGLKPSNRRILFAMNDLNLSPGRPHRKCAKICGDTSGNYHPHGEQVVYPTLVRMAQDFNMRYPLIDGQGNFGSIDGDSAAAMRYTEARLTPIAVEMLADIEKETVDFIPNYDGTLSEPKVMPGKFPNLLCNGTTGIAVGMASSIPPHNVGEICDAALHLLKYPKATIDKLVSLMPGPDFPTGGELVEDRQNIVDAYSTGRGSFRVRAKWQIEDLGRGQYQVVVTEIPYQVQKSRLVERIADLLQSRKLAMLADVRDESADDVRLVLEPKSRTVEPKMLEARGR